MSRLYFTSGWGQITTRRYRYNDGTNIDTAAAWTNFTGTEWVASTSFPEGGYHELVVPISRIPKSGVLTVQIQALKGTDVYVDQTHTFDLNREPDFVGKPQIFAGEWTGTQFKVWVRGNADEDTLSIEWNARDTSDWDIDGNLVGGDFANVTNLSASDKRFLIDIGDYDPSIPNGADNVVYAILRGNTALAAAGDSATKYQRLALTMPLDPRDPQLINDGSVTASQLADVSKRASVNVSMAHGTNKQTELDYSGYIYYADGTNYTLTPGTITLSAGSGVLEYIYFDPTISATALQVNVDATVAKAMTGRRILVGVASQATSPDRAFFVVTGDQPVITAPYIYAASLQAITATMGALEAGSIVIDNGANKMWFNEGNDGVLAVGGTVKGSAPFYVAADGTVTATSIIATGYGQTQRQTTAPATRGDGSALQAGDIWIDTDDGDRIYTYTGAGWSEGLTAIDGGNITAGTVAAARIDVAGIFAQTLTLTGSMTVGTMVMGEDVNGAGWDGIFLNANNYWRDTGVFSVGNGTLGVTWNGSALTVAGSANITGLLTAGTVKIGENVNAAGDNGIYIDSSNYFYVDTVPGPSVGLFRVGNGTEYVQWDGTSLTVAGDLLNAAGTKIFDAATTTISNNANLETLNVTGVLTLAAGGSIATGAAYGLALDKDTITVSTATSSASMTSAGIFHVWEYEFVPGTHGTYIDTDTLTKYGNAHWTIQTTGVTTNMTLAATGDILLSPTGQVTIDGALWPASNSAGYLYNNGGGTLSWSAVAGGATTFTGLTDTPANYTSQANKFVRVNGGATALEFVAASSINVGDFNNDGTYQASDVFLSYISTLVDPNDDRILFYDDDAGVITWLDLGTGLTTNTTTLNLTGIPAGLAAVTPPAGASQIIVSTGSNTWQMESGATARASLGVAIGSDVQAYNAHLFALAGLGTAGAADLFMVSTGVNTWGYETASQVRTTLSLVPGTHVQTQNATLQTLAGTSPSVNSLFGYHTGPGGQAVMFTLGDGLGFTSGPPYKVELDIAGATAGSAADWYNGYTLYETTGGAIKRITVGLPLGSIASLSNPAADRIMFWDNSTVAMGWLSIADGLSITGTTLSTDVRVTSSELQFAEVPGTDATARTFSTYMRARIGSTAYYIPLYV